MSKTFTLWYPEIEPDISNVPFTGLREAVRSAAIKFCEKTHLWKVDLARITTNINDRDYSLTVDASLQAEIIVIDDVQYKSDGEDDDQFRTVYPVSEVQQNRNSGGGWKYSDIESPYNFYVDPVDKTTLYFVGNPTESSTEGLLVTVILKPLKTATSLPDFLYNEYREEIGHGALANLYMKKNMPWFDPNMAAYHNVPFMAACNNGKSRRITGATNMNLQIKMRPLA